MTRITDTPRDESEPTWSPDGRTLYCSLNQGQRNIWTMEVGSLIAER